MKITCHNCDAVNTITNEIETFTCRYCMTVLGLDHLTYDYSLDRFLEPGEKPQADELEELFEYIEEDEEEVEEAEDEIELNVDEFKEVE